MKKKAPEYFRGAPRIQAHLKNMEATQWKPIACKFPVRRARTKVQSIPLYPFRNNKYVKKKRQYCQFWMRLKI